MTIHKINQVSGNIIFWLFFNRSPCIHDIGPNNGQKVGSVPFILCALFRIYNLYFGHHCSHFCIIFSFDHPTRSTHTPYIFSVLHHIDQSRFWPGGNFFDSFVWLLSASSVNCFFSTWIPYFVKVFLKVL